MKAGDTDPPYVLYLTEISNGVSAPIDLTGTTVQFVMVNRVTDIVKVNEPADIVGDPTAGIISYQWTSGDTDTVGDYKILIHITYLSGKIRTFPDEGYNSLRIDKNYP